MIMTVMMMHMLMMRKYCSCQGFVCRSTMKMMMILACILDDGGEEDVITPPPPPPPHPTRSTPRTREAIKPQNPAKTFMARTRRALA